MICDNNKIYHIKKQELLNALDKEYRQYFIGNLSRPQILGYLEQGALEIGTSLYKESKADVPHMHAKTSEIIYIVKGTYKILDINNNKGYVLNEGDFFVIPPKTPYASKAMLNTQVLFVKTGGNDKENIEITKELNNWLNDL